MEGRSLVTEALLARAQSTEVLGGLGNRLPIETYDDSAQFLIPMCDIEIDLIAAVNCIATSGGEIMNSPCW